MTIEHSDFKDTILIFADGACSGNPGPGGWASIVLMPIKNGFHVKELGGRAESTTNNQMELTGVGKALKFIEDQNCRVHIFTDSKYVIKGCTEWLKNWRKNDWQTATGQSVANQNFWKRLHELLDAREEMPKFQYVPGHEGVAGNERCDELAVRFSKESEPELFDGAFEEYKKFLGVDVLENLITHLNEPVLSKEEKKEVYLSYVDGKLLRHETWKECEACVKGRRGARFKKVKSIKEEERVLKEWGIKST